MSELGEKQELFSLNAALLTLEAYKRGYRVREGDSFRDPRVFGHVGVQMGYGHKNSLHKLKLAKDLNLTKDGRYITDDEGHRELHLWWVEQGGNPMIEEDPNHYSWPYGDMK